VPPADPVTVVVSLGLAACGVLLAFGVALWLIYSMRP
jgi:hypothetical protein